MKISEDILYVGVNDHAIDLFEGQYVVPLGMAYNSYVVRGTEKTAVTDTVDARFCDEWLANVRAALGGASPDYLVIHHMEPDHSACIAKFMAEYPSCTAVASAQAFTMMRQFFGEEYETRRKVVREGDVLELGKHSLAFVAAPMVHWPEVMVSYDAADKVLFSADGFGKFGANDVEDPEGWDCEARRYYFGIVGKYGAQTQALLKKAAALDVAAICPLHGPVLAGGAIAHAVERYLTWSSYGVESPGVCIAYTSVYGHTKEAALLLKEELLKRGCPKVACSDLARDDMPETVEDAFRYGTLALCSTTYNGEAFPFMRTFIEHLAERNFRKRTVAFVENGSWAPAATRAMKGLLAGCADLAFAETEVTIRGALDDAARARIAALAEELAK